MSTACTHSCSFLCRGLTPTRQMPVVVWTLLQFSGGHPYSTRRKTSVVLMKHFLTFMSSPFQFILHHGYQTIFLKHTLDHVRLLFKNLQWFLIVDCVKYERIIPHFNHVQRYLLLCYPHTLCYLSLLQAVSWLCIFKFISVEHMYL